MVEDRRLEKGPPDAPGTLTRLIEEVVRGAPDQVERGAWATGLKAGAIVGRYELLREVGRGGFGVVFEARDRELGRMVAFKALRVGGEASRERRLLAEAEVAARLSHPNIVTVLDVGRAEHGVYLVQEFLTGAPLSTRMAGGSLPLREALRIAVEIARGLAHAHAHGVVHRDLTPSNVQLCDDGQVKLLDLGMAAALGRRKLEGGTPAYMAPEQAEAAPEDERTDVYALGVLLYRMLTGAFPVQADASGRPRSRSDSRGLEVPGAPVLGDLVEAMLARAPTDRPRDAGVVLEALREIADTLPRSASGASRVRILPPRRARWIALGVLAGLLAAALVGISAALWLRAGASVAATHLATPLVLAASSAQTTCQWKEVVWTDFIGDDVPLRWRNGTYFGQEQRTVDGVPVWVQGSDWNQLWVPIGDPKPDLFAVEAQFLVPPSEGSRIDVGMIVFSDPVGPMSAASSDHAHGRGVALVEAPGQPQFLLWGLTEGARTKRIDYRAALGTSVSGTWRSLRIEGCRSGGWLRVLLDGRAVLWEVGVTDLTGGHVGLTGQGGSYHQANVMWKHLRVSEGTPACR